MNLAELLTFAVENNASDLHISSGLPPMIRIDGEIRRLTSAPLSKNNILKMLYGIMNEDQRRIFENDNDLDFAHEIQELARFRVNAFQQLRGPSAAFRTIPNKVSSLDDIGAPSVFQSLINKPRGLILVTGPTGSGKSTTLAAMVDLINQRKKAHILTIEDPIEFIHTSKNSIINQRELGQHTNSFASALKASLREDPDIILVGEMRDPETIHLALTAAETGHLVLSTLHTNSASKTVDRIIDSFETGDKSMVRAMLAESVQAIIAQTLLPKIGGGRTGAWEILLGTNAVRNLIRENKIPQIYSTMQTGQQLGMQTLDENLYELVQRGIVSADTVMPLMRDKTKIEAL
ncbi:MAG: twitching motility protein PilT [Saprospiraceae bacterium]|jgi:twitching motility protein PilT